MKSHVIAAVAAAIVFQLSTQEIIGDESAKVGFKVVGKEPPADRYRSCRRMLVGPRLNQPEEYEGYNGFVGWPSVARLRSGRWVVPFTSGLWHATFPWTEAIRKDPKSRAQFEAWHKMGLPDMRAPRGGRAHIMWSDDHGETWSRPSTLVDTENDDRHPTILELDDGTLLCQFFTSRYPRVSYDKYMLSHDGGRTWTEPRDVLGEDDPLEPLPAPSDVSNHRPGPRKGVSTCGPSIQLSDGTVLLIGPGGKHDASSGQYSIGICRSTDGGRTFELFSRVSSDHPMPEPTVTQLADGRLFMVARQEGDMCWSNDGGLTWTQSNSTGWNLYDPHLLQMPSGVLALFHGSYQKGGIRVLLSPDNGHTWHGPGERYGYSVDRSVYGYSYPMILPDGTVYIVYLHTGGHRPADARTEALWGLRVGVHADAGGIDILPAPGSPVAKGQSVNATNNPDSDGGDPELGDNM